MESRKKKLPSEYPLFAVRLAEDQKEALSDLIEKTRSSLNKKLDESEKLWMKNDVVYEALLIGLPLLKDRISNKGKGI